MNKEVYRQQVFQCLVKARQFAIAGGLTADEYAMLEEAARLSRSDDAVMQEQDAQFQRRQEAYERSLRGIPEGY